MSELRIERDCRVKLRCGQPLDVEPYRVAGLVSPKGRDIPVWYRDGRVCPGEETPIDIVAILDAPTEAEPKLSLEVGKSYRAANGKRVGAMLAHTMPGTFIQKQGDGFIWNADGTCLRANSDDYDRRTEWRIVEPWADSAPKPDEPLSDAYRSWDADSMAPEEKARFSVEPSGEGFNTGRTQFRVTCRACGKVIHGGTTHPPSYFDLHVCAEPATDPAKPDEPRLTDEIQPGDWWIADEQGRRFKGKVLDSQVCDGWIVEAQYPLGGGMQERIVSHLLDSFTGEFHVNGRLFQLLRRVQAPSVKPYETDAEKGAMFGRTVRRKADETLWLVSVLWPEAMELRRPDEPPVRRYANASWGQLATDYERLDGSPLGVVTRDPWETE